ALAGAGFEIEELHEPLWETTREKAAHYFAPPSLARLAVRWAGAARRLVRSWRSDRPPPLVVVGFGGQLDVLLAARFCRPRAGLVFAPLVTLSETLVEDRRVFRAGGTRARLAAALDRASMRAADLVLADTAAHADYLEELGVERERVAVWHFGVEPEFVTPSTRGPVPRRVLFYGRYLPLHGIDTIVRAARRHAGPARRRRPDGRGPGAAAPATPGREHRVADHVARRAAAGRAARRAGGGRGGARRLRCRAQGGHGGAEQGLPGGCRGA